MKDVEAALVLAEDGHLQVVTAEPDGRVTWRMAQDDDLRAEDLRGFVRCLRYVLASHLRGHEVRELAEKVTALAKEIERDD